MPVLEKLLSFIAPHECLVCEAEGELVCRECHDIAIQKVPSRCYRCHKLTNGFRVCLPCRASSKLTAVWVAADYAGTAKELIHKLKYQRAQTAARVIAAYLYETLPTPPADFVIVPLPTATSRRRQRGYDQAELIAKEYAHLTGAQYKTLLHRFGQSRQVGTHRKERLEQLETAFWADKSAQKTKVLLIDDVTTTGATLEAAAKVLREAGSSRVAALCFAQA